MKLFTDGREDIRPLGSEDASMSPLPYEGQGRLFKSSSGIIAGATALISITAADWGVGDDFYLTGFTFLGAFTGTYVAKLGLYLKVHEPTSGEVFFANTFNQSRVEWTRIGANIRVTNNFKQIRKLTTLQTIQTVIVNLTNRTLNFSMSAQGISR